MLEEVSESRLARRLIGGAGLVPDHWGVARTAMVGDDNHLESVREREVGDRRSARGASGIGQRCDGKRNVVKLKSVRHLISLVEFAVAPATRVQALERDDFCLNRHPALAFWWSMIFFRKPVPTFRDHALARRGQRRPFGAR